MSDTMEREKNDTLSAKETEEEEEEMKRELLDMGMYETGYTYLEMKKILGFISESKVMANMANDNKNTQKEQSRSSKDHNTDVISKTNLGKDLDAQDHAETSRSIHSYRANHASPILDRLSAQGSSSPESMSTIFESRSSAHRRKSLDSDDALERLHENQSLREGCSHSTNRYVSLRSKNSLQESHSTHIAEMKMDTQSEHAQKLDRWRIDPLDSCVNENDVPLRQPERQAVAQERKLFRRCKDAQAPETLEKVLNLHLKQTAELWHSWHRTTNSKFQWGSPIQVGTANGSLDKKSLTNAMTEQSKTETTGTYSHERPSKRKASAVISSLNARLSSDDEDEDSADFVTLKKKKVQPQESTSRATRHGKYSRAVEDEIPSNLLTNDEDLLLKSDNDDVNSDVDVKDSQRKAYKEDKAQRMSPEVVPRYPRRIIPPNPKRNANASRKKKHNTKKSTESSSRYSSGEEQSATTSMPRKKNECLSKESILMELDKTSDEDTANTAKPNIEIKPIPLKSLSIRLERQRFILKKTHTEKERKMEEEREEARRKEEEEKRKKEELFKKQTEEMQRKIRQKEEAERMETEKRKRWNNVLNVKSKENKERSRSLREPDEFRFSDADEENRLLQGRNTSAGVSRIMEEPMQSTVNCPICNKSFPSDRIETHAAECEQYISDSDEGSSNIKAFESKASASSKNSKHAEMLECDICSVFRTTNGIDYEDHVNSCIQRRHRQEQQSESYGCSSIPIDISTSPVRCYRPISEQTDSEIDYKAQFGSSSRRQIHPSRKRKR